MHPNIIAYEGVEDFQSFSKKDFEKYCDNKLNECNKHISFIKNNFVDDNYRGRVLEVGSGNSKLLYRMEQEGLVDYAVGFEVSSSRVNFANEFGKYIGSKNVENFCGDFLEQDVPFNEFDVVIGVDIVTQLISPFSNDSEFRLLEKMHHILKDGGGLMLELMDFSKTIEMIKLSDGKLRVWKEFGYYDPWQYGLDLMTFENMDVIWDKIFINRNRAIPDSKFRNILRHYTPSVIEEKLGSFGYKNISNHNFWEYEGDIPEKEYIVTAYK